MTDSISKYFNNNQALDQISVTEIEQLIANAPYAAVYKMLLTKKMSSLNNLNMSLVQNDRVLQHYLHNTHIPNLNDLHVPSEKEGLEINRYNQNNDTILSSDINEAKVFSTLVEGSLEINMSNENLEFGSNEIKMEQSLEQEVKEEMNSGVEYPIRSIDKFDTEDIQKTMTKKKTKKKKTKKFKLNEYSGISDFSIWLLSFKNNDIEKQISKEKKAAKKRALEEKANKSVTKTHTIISEPLADILANQGHLDDAKKMYEQLMMKYPEKSSYFATKINQLIKI